MVLVETGGGAGGGVVLVGGAVFGHFDVGAGGGGCGV